MEAIWWRHSILWIGLIILYASTASSLRCYSCSNVLDGKCGITWGYDGAQVDDYIEECYGDTVLCRKLEYEIFPQGEMVVTRSCWNTTSIWIPPDTKCSDMNRGRVCYCASGDEPCNGTQLQHVSFYYMVGLASLICALYVTF